MITIKCPWPDQKLWPNEKKKYHWSTIGKLASDEKDYGFKSTLEALDGKGAPEFQGNNVFIKVIFQKKDHHRFDMDGAYAACKAQIDGIAQALGINDYFFCPVFLDRSIGDKDAVIYELDV